MEKVFVVIEKRTGEVWVFGSKKAIFRHVSDKYGLPLHTLYRMRLDASGHWEDRHIAIYERNVIRIKQKNHNFGYLCKSKTLII